MKVCVEIRGSSVESSFGIHGIIFWVPAKGMAMGVLQPQYRTTPSTASYIYTVTRMNMALRGVENPAINGIKFHCAQCTCEHAGFYLGVFACVCGGGRW